MVPGLLDRMEMVLLLGLGFAVAVTVRSREPSGRPLGVVEGEYVTLPSDSRPLLGVLTGRTGRAAGERSKRVPMVGNGVATVNATGKA